MSVRAPSRHRTPRRELGLALLAAALGAAACAPSARPGALSGQAPGQAPEPAHVQAPDQASRAAGPAAAGDPSAPAAPSAAPSGDELRLAAIERAINQTGETRHACWALGAADNYHLEGTLVLGLTFGAGPTAAVRVLSDQPGDERLTTCMVQLYEAYRWPAVFEPGMAIELPFSFEAPRWQHTVQAAHVPPSELAGGKLSARVLLHEKNTGNGALSLSLLTMRDGLEIPLHRHAAAEVLYVLEGQGTVYGHGHGHDQAPAPGARGRNRRQGPGRSQGVEVRAGQAIYVPAGVAHAFVQRGDTPTRLVQLYTPSGPERRFLGEPAVGTTAVDHREPVPRRAPQPLVRAVPEVYELPGGQSSVAMFFDADATGDRAAYLGVLTAGPGTRIPPHAHAAETEVVLVLSGAGVMTVNNDTLPIAPMTAVQIPPGVTHAFEVTSVEPVVAVQLYTPSGPEQRFKTMATTTTIRTTGAGQDPAKSER